MSVEAPRWPPYSPWLLVALALVAANLRLGLASVGPVLDQVRAGVGLSAAGAGLLTSLPVLTFAVLGGLSTWVARRLAIDRVIGAAMVVLAAALVLRVLGGIGTLMTGTLAVCAAIAVANVLIPVVVKERFPLRIGLVTGVYTAALAGGSALAAGVTAPLASHAGWRSALASWAVPALAAAVLWGAATWSSWRRRPAPMPHRAPSPHGASRSHRFWRSPRAWALTLFFGTQSLQAYAVMGWLPAIYHDAGYSTYQAGWLLALSIVVGVPVSFLVPTLAARSSHQRWWAVAISAASLAGMSRLLVNPGAAGWAWALLIGVGNGAFPLALTFFSLRAATVQDTAWLSTVGQSVGYLIAAIGPLGMGALQAATGSWTGPLLLLICAMALQALVGLVAGRAGHL